MTAGGTINVETKDGAGSSAYVLGYGEGVNRSMAARRAQDRAAFFLPHLRPGMRVLDCGSGPGAITLGLAEAVNPGEVVGVDVEAVQVERASALAAAEAVTNVRFEQGNVYALAFADGSFDAVFEHAMLCHLREPVQALREIGRVLTPGGIVGLRDPALDRMDGPPLVMASLELVQRVMTFNTGQDRDRDPYPHRRWLRLAGFERSEGFAFTIHHGSLDSTRAYAAFHIGRLESQAFRIRAIGLGWTDEPTLAAMIEAVRAWGEHPDAFAATTWSAALGWAPA